MNQFKSDFELVKKLFEAQQYAKASAAATKLIVPARKNNKLLETQLLIAMCNYKLEKYIPAIRMCQTLLRDQNSNLQAWLIIILSAYKADDTEINTHIRTCLSTCQPNPTLLKTIISVINNSIDNTTLKAIVDALKAMPADFQSKYVQFIPKTPTTIDYLAEFASSSNSADAFETINILYQSGKFDECLSVAKNMQANDLLRLQIETLFGDDPVRTAQQHTAGGGTTFAKWHEAVLAEDLYLMKNEISRIPNFFAGYKHFISIQTNNDIKSSWTNAVVRRFPNYPTALSYAADIKDELGLYDEALEIIDILNKVDPHLATIKKFHILTKANRFDEALQLKSEITDLPDDVKYQLELATWKKTKDDSILRKLITIENNKENASVKAKALYLLGTKVDKQQAVASFAELLKIDPENPDIYANFGKFMKIHNDNEKGDFLLKKAVDFGYRDDDDALDIYTRDLINNNELERAHEFCVKATTDWALFRAGMISFKLQKFEEASVELQNYLRSHEDCVEAWTALGFAYMSIGRIMSTAQVLEKLDELGKPSKELQTKFDFIYGRSTISFPISSAEFDIEHTPYMFSTFIRQSTAKLNQYARFGRKETALFLIDNINPVCDIYINKWGHLATVMKECSEYFIASYNHIEDDKMLEKAQNLLMKRCEVDKRGESFIDLSRVLYMRDKKDQSLMVLRRAVKAFPDNPYVWMYLSIAYLMNGKPVYAKHCVSVASRVSTENEKAKTFAIASAIGYVLGDEMLLKKGSDESYIISQVDKDTWEMKTIAGTVDQYSGFTLAFENGSKNAASQLVRLSLEKGKPYEALGYAMILRDNELIADCYEACGHYEDALLFTKDEEKKQRLSKFTGKEYQSENALSLYLKGNYSGAASEFIKMGNVYGNLGAAACLLMQGREQDAIKVVAKQIEQVDENYRDSLQYMIMKIDNKAPVQLRTTSTNSLRKDLTRTDDKIQAAYQAYLDDMYRPDVIKFFVVQAMRMEQVPNQYKKEVDRALNTLVKTTGSRDAMLLQVMWLLKIGRHQQANPIIQKLCVMSPSMTKTLRKWMRPANQ